MEDDSADQNPSAKKLRNDYHPSIQDPRLIALMRVSAYCGMYSSPRQRLSFICKWTVGILLLCCPIVKVTFPLCSATYNQLIEQKQMSTGLETASLFITPMIFLWYHGFFEWLYLLCCRCKRRDSNAPVAPYFWDNDISRELFSRNNFRISGREAVLNSSLKWTKITVYLFMLNMIVVFWSIGFELHLGLTHGLMAGDMLRLAFISIAVHSIEVVNVNVLLILFLHTRMYRKILKVYFRVQHTTMLRRANIGNLPVYHEMMDMMFFRLGRLSSVMSLMCMGLVWLLIACTLFAVISPLRQWHSTTVYTFLLGILVTGIWGYFVATSVTGLFDAMVLPFVQAKARFSKAQQGKLDGSYVDDMLECAELVGFDGGQVAHIRAALDYWEKNSKGIMEYAAPLADAVKEHGAAGLFNSSAFSSLARKGKQKLTERMLRKAGSRSQSPSLSGSSRPQSQRGSAKRLPKHPDMPSPSPLIPRDPEGADPPKLSIDGGLKPSQVLASAGLNESNLDLPDKGLSEVLRKIDNFYDVAMQKVSTAIDMPETASGATPVELINMVKSSEAVQQRLKKKVLRQVLQKLPGTDLLSLIADPSKAQQLIASALQSQLEENGAEIQARLGAAVTDGLKRVETLKQKASEMKTDLEPMVREGIRRAAEQLPAETGDTLLTVETEKSVLPSEPAVVSTDPLSDDADPLGASQPTPTKLPDVD